MNFRKLLLIIVLAITTLIAYQVQDFWKKRIDPRRSGKDFLLFIVLNLISVLVLVFIAGFFIIHFKEFFFKR